MCVISARRSDLPIASLEKLTNEQYEQRESLVQLLLPFVLVPYRVRYLILFYLFSVIILKYYHSILLLKLHQIITIYHLANPRN
jgi:hypothetical protein